ncbi:MAG: hypothetical protein M1818_006146 [Claussenomyces sp. TS43310]|nr:MAG: hypothetical protein M1818_006146 [Claussenomyces sp. TS43310]
MAVDTNPQNLRIQTYIWYPLCMAFISARIFAIGRRDGWKHLKIDDYLMMLATIFYTVMVLTLIRSTAGDGGIGFTPEQIALFTEDEKAAHILNAKYVQICEQFTLLTIYTAKWCMLVFYGRVTLGLKARFLVKFAGVYIVVGFIATEISMFTLCRPYSQYWALPSNDPDQCAFYRKYSIPQGVFNISSDILMLGIPIPLVITSKMAVRQKVAATAALSMGLFVVLASILSKTFALQARNLDNIVYAFWYLREASVAMLVANIIVLWPWLRAGVQYIVKICRKTRGTSSDTPSSGPSQELDVRTARARGSRPQLSDEEGGDFQRVFLASSSQERILSQGVILKNQSFNVHVSDDDSIERDIGFDEPTSGRNRYTVDVNARMHGDRR